MSTSSVAGGVLETNDSRTDILRTSFTSHASGVTFVTEAFSDSSTTFQAFSSTGTLL